MSLRDDFTERELEILRSDQIDLAFFFRAALPDGAVRLWAGAGDFALTVAQAGEAGAGHYIGAGRWGGPLPELDFSVDGQMQGQTFTWSAVDLEATRAYLKDRSKIVDAPAAFGWAVLDERHRLAGRVRWPLVGVLSQPKLARTRVDGLTRQRSLSVTLVAGAYARRRGEHSYYTGVDQRRRHPTDAGCDRTGLYTVETTRPLPR